MSDFIISNNSYVWLAFHILLTHLLYFTLKWIILFTVWPPECAIISWFFYTAPKTYNKAFPKQQSPLSSQALQIIQTQLYQDEKYLLCFHSFFGAIKASSPSCAVRGGEEREKKDASGEWEKSLFVFVKEEERAVIITLEALDCNLSPLCVNLCIHQVFLQAPFEKITLFLPSFVCEYKTKQGTCYLFASERPHH